VTPANADFETFLAANETAQAEMGVRDAVARWANSPFEWVMYLPSRSRGTAGEKLVEAWLRRLGLAVGPPVNTGHDRFVNGAKIEINSRFATDGSAPATRSGGCPHLCVVPAESRCVALTCGCDRPAYLLPIIGSIGVCLRRGPIS
jgi:hypothetical protein